MTLHEQQVEREKAQRDAALGRRARGVLEGDLGPVLKRWVSGTISPVADRLRGVARRRLAGDFDGAAGLLSSEVFGLAEFAESNALKPILRWCLEGHSPGRGGPESTYCDDLVLAVLATAIQRCAREGGQPCPLTGLLRLCADAARETALGQFIVQVQGAKAMMRVRRSGRAAWAQHKQMDSVAALLSGQVRSALTEDSGTYAGGGRVRSVVTIRTESGEARRIDLRPPTEADWRFLEVARHVKGERDPHLATWKSFAMLVLCAAQAEAGWFDLVKVGQFKTRNGTRRRRTRGKAHCLVLAEAAEGAIRRDLERWMQMGFSPEPMIVPPEDGDYLTVKHRAVAGRRGPMGLKTQAKDSAAWETACEVMGKTAWKVHPGTLMALRDSEFVRSLAAKSEPDETRMATILASYRRVATLPELYFPLFMDFRGRVYTRPSWVTYQGTDLQKGLLQFPPKEEPSNFDADAWFTSQALHLGALGGLDKAPLGAREAWCNRVLMDAGRQAVRGEWEGAELGEVLEKADEPIQLLTALQLVRSGSDRMVDCLPCQIDGTCNGLQHLTALFRDETAAPFVNLTASTFEDHPADIYAEVAKRVSAMLLTIDEPWAQRLRQAVKIDRKLCKKPVMVLPYGGTRGTIEDAVLSAILDQDPPRAYWTLGLGGDPLHGPTFVWPDHTAGNYQAFAQRDLKDHPLLHLDARRLGGLVWDAIVAILPKPMAAMAAFRAVAKAVGERTLEWSTNFHSIENDDLWVVQAKAKAAKRRLNFRGFHLPSSVRGLQMLEGRDEVDPAAHTSGIVANFIHSMDAAHLARTMRHFRTIAGTSFGAVHDCFIARPSEMGRLGSVTRLAFRHQYLADPLAQPVRLRTPGENPEEFATWYALAEAVGVSFPEKGKWEPGEVLDSAWFFS